MTELHGNGQTVVLICVYSPYRLPWPLPASSQARTYVLHGGVNARPEILHDDYRALAEHLH